MPERETYDEDLDRPPARGRGKSPLHTIEELERRVLSIPPTGSYRWQRTREIEPEARIVAVAHGSTSIPGRSATTRKRAKLDATASGSKVSSTRNSQTSSSGVASITA